MSYIKTMERKMIKENCLSFKYSLRIDTYINRDFEMSNNSVFSDQKHSQDSVLDFILLDMAYLKAGLDI